MITTNLATQTFIASNYGILSESIKFVSCSHTVTLKPLLTTVQKKNVLITHKEWFTLASKVSSLQIT
jgi:hypothetical protein